MNEHQELSNPENYLILIQIKGNRRLRRKTSYLTENNEFTENIQLAKRFQNLLSAEQMLQIITNLISIEARPRIIIKYCKPEDSKQRV